MIYTTQAKPGQGMPLNPIKRPKLAAVSEFRQTKTAIRQLSYIDGFINYFERVKGHKPEVVHLRPEQFVELGVAPGKRRNGVRLEVTQ
ncbi:hypothetical protein [Marinobacter sp. SS21]|uniref:hypothetical protein n=1 Tax=Marinobacter sp. SS21 TaxID=2979460 RepID=UPI00232B0B4F|nr:hypothetical protein [Marinobacter sp. SS21]MDC0664364.1 hypothetical protein [Marinobacter sp. SS21]